MYLPYLRGKQFKLIALREFIESNPGNINILPIIEPVKSSYNGIKLAIKCFFKVDFKFALIINPSDGDFKKSKQIGRAHV